MASLTETTSIIIVDDHALVREGMVEILSTVDGFTVLGEAGDARQAIAMTAEFRPDVVLLDVEMGDSDVVKTIAGIHACRTDCRIIILSMHDDPALIRGLLAQGVHGYLLKNATRQELIGAIRSSLHIPPAVPSAFPLPSQRTPQTAALEPPQPPSGKPPKPLLTSREVEILRLVSEALTNLQVARRLLLTEATVKRHLRVIFARLNAVSRIDAVNRAIALGLLDPPQQRYDGPLPEPQS
jgi:DNA-binding NarL/FixJ family response regulator